MEKDSALYQLMDARMNGVMNGIVKGCGEYQTIIRKSDEYSGRLDGMPLSQEVRLLIDGYVSEQNALGSRFGMLAYLLGFSDCKAMFLGKCLPTEVKEMTTELYPQSAGQGGKAAPTALPPCLFRLNINPCLQLRIFVGL